MWILIGVEGIEVSWVDMMAVVDAATRFWAKSRIGILKDRGLGNSAKCVRVVRYK